MKFVFCIVKLNIMSWKFGNSKQNRFVESQNKKAVLAGITRAIQNDELIYIGDGIHKKFIDVAYDEMQLPWRDGTHDTLLQAAKKHVYDSLAKGSVTLSSKEDVRNYIKKEFI